MKRIFLTASVAAAAFLSVAPAYAANIILTDDDRIGPANSGYKSNFYIESMVGNTTNASIRRPGLPLGHFEDNFFFAPIISSFGTGSSITSNQNLLFDIPGLTITAYSLGGGPGTPIFDALSRAFTTDVCTSNLATTNASVCTSGSYFDDAQFVAGLSAGPGLFTVAATDFTDPHARSASSTLIPGLYYKINLQGNVAPGTLPAQYNGNLVSTGLAVPEPATWAMLLVGFGAIGFAMRRGRKPQPKVRFAF